MYSSNPPLQAAYKDNLLPRPSTFVARLLICTLRRSTLIASISLDPTSLATFFGAIVRSCANRRDFGCKFWGCVGTTQSRIHQFWREAVGEDCANVERAGVFTAKGGDELSVFAAW